MKILHCADIHLDSKLSANLDPDKARIRRTELLNTFTKLADYAHNNDIHTMIIAGDLFDSKHISAAARNTVKDFFIRNDDIDFYYLRGNHDTDGFLSSFDTIPDNLKLFHDAWTTYTIPFANGRKMTISGIELNDHHASSIYHSLLLDPNNYNIVVMHGQLANYPSKEAAEIIDLSALRNHSIDYLALGHIHEHIEDDLPPRGIYCYPGCLEGRGYDESGTKGFVLLDINEDTLKSTVQFVPFAKRTMYTISVDITGCMTTPDITHRINAALKANPCTAEDMVKIICTGEVNVDCEKNMAYLDTALKEHFFFAKIQDDSKLAVNYSDYAQEASLKGEFVRLVQSSNYTEEEKTEIIRCGIQALNQEEIDL